MSVEEGRSANPDQSVAKYPKVLSVRENMTEMVKLLRMTKGDKQSMSDFYDQIKLQANKCGIKNPDTMVRDRLIQAITEEAVLEEVMRLDRPTAEDVFQKYTQIVKECVAMPNLEAMTGTMIGSRSNDIYDHVMKSFSVERNRPFNSKCKDVTSVTLTRIADSQKLMSCFDHIQHLTMRDMKLLNGISGVPRSLRNLTLINVKIEGKLFEQLLLNNKDTLKYLHLDHVKSWDHANPSDGIYDFKRLCPKLSTLIVKSTSLNMRSDGILKFISERLYYNRLCKNLYIEDLTGFKYLTIISWSPLNHWSDNNEIPSKMIIRLAILKSNNMDIENDDKETKIKSLVIDYFDSTVKDMPDPKENSDPLEVNPDIPRPIPENLETWIKSAPSFEKLTVKNVANDYLLWMLPYCTGLKKVTLFVKECTENFKRGLSQQLTRNINQMSNLTDLTVDSNIDCELLLKLLDRNKDTLTKLFFKVQDVEAWVRFKDIWGKVAEMENLTNFEIVKTYKEQANQNEEIWRILSFTGAMLEIFTLNGLSCSIDLLSDFLGLRSSNSLFINGSSLNTLQSLSIWYSEDVIFEGSLIMQLVKTMPCLNYLIITIPKLKFSLEFVEELKNYLIDEKRALSLTFLQ